jgi:hypothetical protein
MLIWLSNGVHTSVIEILQKLKTKTLMIIKEEIKLSFNKIYNQVEEKL